MISRTDKGFFAAHYDWLVALVGLLALAGGAAFYVLSMGEDVEVAAEAEVSSVIRPKGRDLGVKPVDMTAYAAMTRALKTPPTSTEISVRTASFLASERWIFCRKCSKVILGDLKTNPKCVFCGEKQEDEVKVVLDADKDGLPDDWEKRYGLNNNDKSDADADKDKDGFTNREEYQAKTDPTDPKDHPDYLDSLKLVLPLKETKMPFVFRKASQIPGGWRCEFFDPARKDDFGRTGRTVSAKVGEKVIDAGFKEKFDYGFTLKSYTAKSEKRERKGMKGMMVDVDISEVVLERQKDGKQVKLKVQTGKGAKPASVDVVAVLEFARGPVRKFEVTPGSTIKLFDTQYKILEVAPLEKGAKVTVENVLSGKKRTLQALES